MKIEESDFEVLIPNVKGSGTSERVKIRVKQRWDEDLKEWLLTPESLDLIESTQARHMGLIVLVQVLVRRYRQRWLADFRSR